MHRLERRSLVAAALACAAALIAAVPAPAATIRIDASTPGTVYDGLVDGFPGIAPLDGTADVGGNALGVALKSGVTEERGIAELSLAPLAGVSAGSVTSATLHVNIDDVLSTFGPGTEFDGTAADRIDIVLYAGNGEAALADFQEGNGAVVASIDTTSAGVITDASLGTSGPLDFSVDVTAAFESLLSGGAAFLGVVFLTDDAGSGTSLDDLGLGSAGPPGVGGAELPYLVVETTGGPVPTPTPGGNTPTPHPTRTPGPDPGPSSPIGVRAEAKGDQLVFYYDARDTFTTFLNLRNDASETLTVLLRVYGPDLGASITETLSLAPGATRTIDVADLRDGGLPAQFGLALASAIGGAGNGIVSRGLSGSFTVANLETSSAWGAPAAARRAVTVTTGGIGTPALGSIIDGDPVVLRAIRPDVLLLSNYYDPDTLQPAAQGGHQLVFLSFGDDFEDAAAAIATATVWDVTVTTNSGAPIVAPSITTTGVVVSDLVSVGGEAVRGRAGGMLFGAHPPGGYNRIIFFTESLGTFATGYSLPAVTQ